MTNQLRVLIVEDSEHDAELLLLELRRGGYDVQFQRVQTAATMLKALSDSQWDIIITDYYMPQFDANAALALARDSGLEIPVIVVSGTIGEETAVSALQAGAHDFILKGKLTRLLPAIERGLRVREARIARKRAEESLRASEARYRRIVETTNEGIWAVDKEQRTTFVNQRMSSLLMLDVRELMDRRLSEFVHPDSREDVARALQHHERGVSGQVEARFLRGDGSDLWVLFDATSIIDPSHGYEGALAMLIDVSKRKQLEDQLRQAQKMEAVGRLAGGIAHDFNNILSVILSYSDMNIERLEPGDAMREEFEEIRTAGSRAKELTRQLLAFSRQQHVEPRILDLNEVVTGMASMLRRLLGEDALLSLVTGSEPGRILADPSQVEQIIMNLVVNARDAMPSGGKVTVETANVELDTDWVTEHHGVVAGHYVMLAVTDTGTGMDLATKRRVFEPFFTTKEQGKGTGLGLSTVFGIVKQSNGHVWVNSELGKGTTFRVYLPRADGNVEVVQPLTSVQARQCSETILVVEDEDQVRNTMRIILRRRGFNVLEAENGGEAFMTCEKFTAPIHLLITDVVMPRMSGPELAERLRSMRPDMKVLYVSGYTDNAIAQHGVLESGVWFLQKPITPDTFVKRVREVLDAAPQPLQAPSTP